MLEFFFTYLDWILGMASLLGQLFLLRKLWWSPYFGLGLQGLWVTYAINRGDYGLLPATCGFPALYVYGIVKWTRERHHVLVAKDTG